VLGLYQALVELNFDAGFFSGRMKWSTCMPPVVQSDCQKGDAARIQRVTSVFNNSEREQARRCGRLCTCTCFARVRVCTCVRVLHVCACVARVRVWSGLVIEVMR
jgi:hypothetical protein